MAYLGKALKRLQVIPLAHSLEPATVTTKLPSQASSMPNSDCSSNTISPAAPPTRPSLLRQLFSSAAKST